MNNQSIFIPGVSKLDFHDRILLPPKKQVLMNLESLRTSWSSRWIENVNSCGVFEILKTCLLPAGHPLKTNSSSSSSFAYFQTWSWTAIYTLHRPFTRKQNHVENYARLSDCSQYVDHQTVEGMSSKVNTFYRVVTCTRCIPRTSETSYLMLNAQSNRDFFLLKSTIVQAVHNNAN